MKMNTPIIPHLYLTTADLNKILAGVKKGEVAKIGYYVSVRYENNKYIVSNGGLEDLEYEIYGEECFTNKKDAIREIVKRA